MPVMPSFALQKTVSNALKGNLSGCERLPFAFLSAFVFCTNRILLDVNS